MDTLKVTYTDNTMNEIHEKERELDCLDYLVFMMDKKSSDRKERQL